MAQLFTRYSLSEIVLFLIILAVAIKNFIEFIDWSKRRTKEAIEQSEKPEQLKKITEKHEQELKEIRQELNTLNKSIELLIESDKDDIKHSITKDHHYFCYKLNSIDDYSLDCVQRRYSHYKEEGGNSFIDTLMQDLRNLPRKIETENR